MIQKQAEQVGKNKETLAKEKQKMQRQQEKAAEESRKKEEALLYKPAQTQKVPFGVGMCSRPFVCCSFFKW